MKHALARSRGYTLIELVVALAVLALASVLIVEALRFGLRAWDTVSSHLSRAEDVALTQQVLRRRLSQLYPYRVDHQQSGTKLYPLVGQTEEVSFSTPGPNSQAGQMLRYRVYLDHLAQGGALKIAWRPDPGPDVAVPQDAPGSEETLLEHVDSATFEYFARKEDAPGEWLPTWLNQASAPGLIRLRLHFADGATGDWPTLVIRPRIDIPADCQFDPVSRRCY